MNTVLIYGFLQKVNWSLKYPIPKPYGPGFNMQFFPNIFILHAALNVRLSLKQKKKKKKTTTKKNKKKTTVVNYTLSYMLSKFWQIE